MKNILAGRKDAHLDLCLDKAVESIELTAGLGGYTLEYDALPELNLDDIDLSVTVLGRRLRAPIIVGAMTGGTPRAQTVNERLARAAARLGLGMTLGSQRAMIENPALVDTFAVRKFAPELPLLIGNLGAVQLNYGVTARDIQTAIDAVSADAFTFHLNPLQEALQPEGDTRFAGLTVRLCDTVSQLSVPCLVKEVGAGISEKTAAKLAALPIAGVEASGVGGTSWARVESYRSPEGSAQNEAGRNLTGFGVPTARSILACRAALGDRLVIGSGGIRTGMDVAVALAFGADLAAIARPLLTAAADSEEAVVSALEALIYELKVVAFCTGATTPHDLRKVRVFAPDELMKHERISNA